MRTWGRILCGLIVGGELGGCGWGVGFYAFLVGMGVRVWMGKKWRG